MKYEVVSTIHSSEGPANAGDEVDLSDAEAKELLRAGAIVPKYKAFERGVMRITPEVEGQTSGLSSLVEAVHKASEAVLEKINGADLEIKILQRERGLLTESPVSRADFMLYVRSDIERRGEPFKDALRRWQAKWFQNSFIGYERRETSGQLQGIPYLNAEIAHQGTEMTTAAFYWMFGEQIANRFEAALDALPWPDTSVPVAERRLRLAEIHSELGKLNDFRDSLARELAAVGIYG